MYILNVFPSALICRCPIDELELAIDEDRGKRDQWCMVADHLAVFWVPFPKASLK